MKVEHISANVFVVDLSTTEFAHLMDVSLGDAERMKNVFRLWCEIGFYTSTAISKNVEDKCKLQKFPSTNSSLQ